MPRFFRHFVSLKHAELRQVYPAQLDGGSFRTFAAVGIDLNLAVTQDLDSSLADWTGDGSPELILADYALDQPNLIVRAMRRATSGNLAFEFDPQNRSVTYAGFEPRARLSFGSDTSDSVRTGDLAAPDVLSLSPRMKVRRERYHDSNNLVSNRTFEENTGRLAAITTGTLGSLQKWDFRWDKNGSLSERADTTNGADWKETFIYDKLDRLTTVKQVRMNGVTSNLDTLTLGYDQLGNITSKTGTGIANIGSYQYKTVEAGCANQAGPHAASLVNGKSYCYDLNGNNTEVRKNGSVIRTIVYTGFDLAESIVRDEMTPEGRIQAQVSFKYGTDRGMFKRVDGGIQAQEAQAQDTHL